MTRRGGFRPGAGNGDDGFRLLPRSWKGRGTAAAASGESATTRTAGDTTTVSEAPADSGGNGGGPDGGGLSGKSWAALLAGGLGVIVIGAFAGYYLLTHLVIGLSLKNQPGSVYFPPEFTAVARVTNNLDIKMDGVITAQVPFKQTLNLPLKGRYKADVEIDAPVPVKFDVVYDGTIPVDTFADITARADFNFQDVKTYRELEIKAKLPMKMALPVKLTAPVDTTIDFKYKGPLVMGLDQTIQAPVDTVLDTRLVVNQNVNTPVTADIPLKVTANDDEPVKVILTEANLELHADTLRLEVADDTDQPQRVDSPWGPTPVSGAAGPAP